MGRHLDLVKACQQCMREHPMEYVRRLILKTVCDRRVEIDHDAVQEHGADEERILRRTVEELESIEEKIRDLEFVGFDQVVAHLRGEGKDPAPIHRVSLCSKGCCFECEACAKKPGSPLLCNMCLERRANCNAGPPPPVKHGDGKWLVARQRIPEPISPEQFTDFAFDDTPVPRAPTSERAPLSSPDSAPCAPYDDEELKQRPPDGPGDVPASKPKFEQVDGERTSTRFCPCGSSYTWEGVDDGLAVWVVNHTPHLGTAPEVLRVSRAQTEPAARVTEEKREEGAPEVIRAETVPGSDAEAIHWPTLLAVVGMLRVRIEQVRSSEDVPTEGILENAYGVFGRSRSRSDHITDLRDVARISVMQELRAMADKLEKKAVGKVPAVAAEEPEDV